MKTIEDLKKVWLELEKKYNVTFEVKEKPYPESIIQGAKIVDSMWLFIYVNDWKLTSWRLNANCKDDIFELHMEDLESQIKEIKFWIKTKEETELPF